MMVLFICVGLIVIKFVFEYQLKVVMVLIVVVVIFDGFDGWVVCILDVQLWMGVEIDLLVDVVNFGVIFVLVFYVLMLLKWLVGWVVVLFYVVCVVLWLVWYNVLQDDGIQFVYVYEFFVGMFVLVGVVFMIGLLVFKMQFGEGWWILVWFFSFWVMGMLIFLVSGILMKKMYVVLVLFNYVVVLLVVLVICVVVVVLVFYLLIWVIIIVYMCYIFFVVCSQCWFV